MGSNTMRDRITDEKGFSLVEVLVATVVLAIGLLGVALMQYAAVAGNVFGREMQIAAELGQEKLEIFKAADYERVVSGVETLSDVNNARFGGRTFTRRWWVKDDCRDISVREESEDPCDPASDVACMSASNNMKALEVRVCWLDEHGGNHSISLNGILWDERAIP